MSETRLDNARLDNARPDLDELEKAYKQAMAGTVKPPMVCTQEGFWILNENDGTYTKHDYEYDPDSDLDSDLDRKDK